MLGTIVFTPIEIEKTVRTCAHQKDTADTDTAFVKVCIWSIDKKDHHLNSLE